MYTTEMLTNWVQVPPLFPDISSISGEWEAHAYSNWLTQSNIFSGRLMNAHSLLLYKIICTAGFCGFFLFFFLLVKLILYCDHGFCDFFFFSFFFFWSSWFYTVTNQQKSVCATENNELQLPLDSETTRRWAGANKDGWLHIKSKQNKYYWWIPLISVLNGRMSS